MPSASPPLPSKKTATVGQAAVASVEIDHLSGELTRWSGLTGELAFARPLIPGQIYPARLTVGKATVTANVKVEATVPNSSPPRVVVSFFQLGDDARHLLEAGPAEAETFAPRAYERVKVSRQLLVKARLQAEGSSRVDHANVIDVSRGGVKLTVRGYAPEWPVDSVLGCQLTSGHIKVACTLSMVWAEQGAEETVVGLRFHTLSRDDYARLVQLIHLASQRGIKK